MPKETARKLRAEAQSLKAENALLRAKLVRAVLRAHRLEVQLKRKKAKR